MSEHCMRCARDPAYRDESDWCGCQILGRSLLYQVEDPEYPRELIIDEQKGPICTAFVPEGEQIPELNRDDQTLDMFV